MMKIIKWQVNFQNLKELRDNITNKILSYNYEEIIKDEISFGSYDKK